MTEPERIDTTSIRAVAKFARDAADHFERRKRSLAGASEDLSYGAFVGGYGETGGYYGRLRKFGDKYYEVLEEFIEDESEFVAFLDGLAARLNNAAGIYDANESHNAQSFQNIEQALGGQ